MQVSGGAKSGREAVEVGDGAGGDDD